MDAGGVGVQPGEAFVVAYWPERTPGAHLRGRVAAAVAAAAGKKPGASSSHPGLGEFAEVVHVGPSGAGKEGCGASGGGREI